MLADRVKVTLILLPIGLVVFYIGGIVYVLAMALVLGLAANEYASLFRVGGMQPSAVLVVLGTVALALSRAWNAFESAPWILTLVIMATMGYHLMMYERGRPEAGTDFAITLSGIIYFGWLGSYLISLRQMPGGFWWLLLTLGIVWVADSGAYFVGRKLGRHKMSPRLSPKKTWEGFGGGVLGGVIGGILLVLLFQLLPGSVGEMKVWHGIGLGLVLSLITPLGDLGESMIKRQVGMKDSGKLLPGHGGAWDRIDSWLWACVIGYYLILVFLSIGG
jgi:phosphatidate cytidylyltransferase